MTYSIAIQYFLHANVFCSHVRIAPNKPDPKSEFLIRHMQLCIICIVKCIHLVGGSEFRIVICYDFTIGSRHSHQKSWIMIVLIARTIDSVFESLDKTGHVTDPFHIGLSAYVLDAFLDSKDEISWISQIMELHQVTWNGSCVDLATFDITNYIQ